MGLDLRAVEHTEEEESSSMLQEGIQGIAEIPSRVLYDTFSSGMMLGNTIQGMRKSSEEVKPYLLDASKTYWEATEALRATEPSAVTKGVNEIGAFLSSTMALSSKISKIPKVLQLAKTEGFTGFVAKNALPGAVGGAIADLTHTRASDKTLTDVFTSPEDRGVLLQYLTSDADDSELEGRLKHVLEGGMLGVLADGVVEAALKFFKSTKNVLKRSGDTPNEVERVISEALEGSIPKEEITKTFDDQLAGSEFIPIDNRPPKAIPVGKSTEDIKAEKHIEDIIDKAPKKAPIPKKEFKKTGVKSLDTNELSHFTTRYKSVAKAISSTEEGNISVVKQILDDPDATEAQKNAATEFYKLYGNKGGGSVMNHKLHGKHISEETTRMFETLGISRKLALGTKKLSRTNIEIEAEGIRKLQENVNLETPGIWKQFGDEGYNVNNLVRLVSTSTSSDSEIQEALLILMNSRHAAAEDFAAAAKELVNNGMDLTNSKIGGDLLKTFRALDEIDQVIDGKASTTGRTLNLLNASTTADVGRLINRNLDHEKLVQKARRENKTIEEITSEVQIDDSVLGAFNLATSKGQKKLLERFFKNVAAGKISTKAEMKKALSAGDFHDVYQAWFRGALLANFSTLFKGVLLSNAIMVGWKNVMYPVFQAGIQSLRGGLVRNARGDFDHGFRSVQSLIGLQSSLYSTAKGLKNITKDRSIAKGIDRTFNIIGEVKREGVSELNVAKKAEVREHLEILSEALTSKKALYRARLIDLITPLVSSSMGVANTFVRGIENSDRFMKGVSTEATLDRKAHEAWYRVSGPDRLGHDNIEDYLEEFGTLQRSLIAINNDAKLSTLNAEKEVEKLFAPYSDKTREEVWLSVAKAKETAEEASLQSDVSDVGGTTGLINSFIQTLNKAAGKSTSGKVAMTTTVPFQKTPVVFLKELQDHSFWAVTSRRFWGTLKNGTPVERIETLAKVASGLSLMGAFSILAAEGRLSGTKRSYEIGKTEELNIPDNSMLIDGTWWDISALGPFAVLAASVADWYRLREKDPTQSVLSLGAMSMSIAAQEGHVATIAELIDIAQSDNVMSKGSNFAFNRTAAALTPLSSLTKNVGTTIDNGVYRTTVDKEVDGLAGLMRFTIANGLKDHAVWRIGSNMAGLGLYEADYSMLGDDMYKHSGDPLGGFLHLMGLGNNVGEKEPWIIEMAAYGQVPNNSRTSSLEGVTLTSNEFIDIQRATAAGAIDTNRIMNDLVSSDFYRNAGDGVKEKLLEEQWGLIRGTVLEVFKSNSERWKKERDIRYYLDALIEGRSVSEAAVGSEERYREARTLKDELNPKSVTNREAISELLGHEE